MTGEVERKTLRDGDGGNGVGDIRARVAVGYSVYKRYAVTVARPSDLTLVESLWKRLPGVVKRLF